MWHSDYSHGIAKECYENRNLANDMNSEMPVLINNYIPWQAANVCLKCFLQYQSGNPGNAMAN